MTPIDVARTIEVRLADGTPSVVHPLTTEDEALLVAGFERLSAESRYRRFLSCRPCPA